MPFLFPNLRITQVFGANTDVGKTLLTTALLRASASRHAGASVDGKRVFYLKPVSTGPEDEADVSYVERNAGRHKSLIETKNLFSYREPMSPHLAAILAPDLPFPKTNDALISSISDYITTTHSSLPTTNTLSTRPSSLYIETAGGVHSPALHPPHTQSTFLRPLRLPSVLVASPHLGGISTTLSSYESLLIRGYSISAVLCLHDGYYRNHEFLREYFDERGIKFWEVAAPPKREGTRDEDAVRLGEWYDRVEGSGQGNVGQCAEWLDEEHMLRMQKLDGMPERTLSSVWWPFTQHGLVNKKEEVMVIDSAHNDCFDAYYAKPPATASPPAAAGAATTTAAGQSAESLLNSYFDGSASWFTQSHGHASEPLTLAAAEAAGRYGHVLFPSGTHEPALNLAEKLLQTVGQGWADRVFYSDNGSTGIEVALKMALRAAGRRYGWKGEDGTEVGVIGLRGGYHGDTIGSMDASEASTFNTVVDWYKGRGHWFSPPMVQYIDGVPTVLSTPPDDWPTLPTSLESAKVEQDGWSLPFDSISTVYDVEARSSSPLAEYYRQHIRSTLEKLVAEGRKFGALVMEPVCLGAGGMVFVDPLFQKILVEVVRDSTDLFGPKPADDGSSRETLATASEADGWSGLPVVYDEGEATERQTVQSLGLTQVFSGLHRFGYHSAASVLGHTPDIAVYAKILTGGLLPLSATLASKSIFASFLSDKKVDALLHGHSYTANPIGCSVALKGIQMMEGKTWDEERALWKGSERWSFWSEAFIKSVSGMDGVKGSMAMGTVLAIELEGGGGYSSHAALDFLTALRQVKIASDASSGDFSPFQIHSRPLGNVVYIMTSLLTTPPVMRAMERAVLDNLTRQSTA